MGEPTPRTCQTLRPACLILNPFVGFSFQPFSLIFLSFFSLSPCSQGQRHPRPLWVRPTGSSSKPQPYARKRAMKEPKNMKMLKFSLAETACTQDQMGFNPYPHEKHRPGSAAPCAGFRAAPTCRQLKDAMEPASLQPSEQADNVYKHFQTWPGRGKSTAQLPWDVGAHVDRG